MSFNKVNQSTAELSPIAGSTLTSIYADAPIGAISAYGGDTAPTGWLKCDGSAISRTTYADLYAVIGTKFGAGDGSTTFNLPDGSISAAVYPVEDVGEYIIKAVQTSVPADFETALALKQDITDNTLETTDKTIPGAINELNADLTETSVTTWDPSDSSATAIELFKCRKIKNLCAVSFYLNSGSTTTGQWLQILRITDSDFYPSSDVRFSFNDMNGNNFIGMLDTYGNMKFMQTVQGVFQGCINFCWFVD